MNAQATCGLLVVAILTIGGIYIVGAVSRWVHPLRLELFEMAQNEIENPRINQRDRKMYNALLDNACSFRAGWLVPKALVRTLKRYLWGEIDHSDNSRSLSQQDKIIGFFALSTLIANPIAFLISLPLGGILLVVGAIRRERPRAAFTADTRSVASVRFCGL